MHELLFTATSPLLYSSIVGILAAFYITWTLARQQYLGGDKLFNLLALSVTAGWFAGWIVQSITNQIWENPLSLNQLWVHPTPLVALAGYIGIWLVATRYIRAIRYPYWRLMDMLFIAIGAIQVALLLGWTIAESSWLSVIALVAAIVSMAVIVWLYRKIQQPGIIAGLQSALFFSLIFALHLTVPAWQVQSSSVEWITDVVGIVLGVTLVALRLSAKSEKVILQDIPRGVSQSFYETFTRAFGKKSTKQESGK